MCVVLACDKVRPDQEMVDKAWKQNDHGGGIAWRENGKVRWAKGLTKDEMSSMIATLPLPFIAHFRIASVGGTTDQLCHPFEVSKTAYPKLEGTTRNPVLFHNGTWGIWRTRVEELAFKSVTKIPKGEWNDTRAMAWIASILGEDILTIINEKTVVFGPDKMDFYGTGWSDEKGIVVSNRIFLNASTFHRNTQQMGGGSTSYPSHQGPSQVYSAQRGLDHKGPKDVIISALEKAGGTSHLLDLPFRGRIAAFQKWQDNASAAESHQKSGGQTPLAGDAAKSEGQEEQTTPVTSAITGKPFGDRFLTEREAAEQEALRWAKGLNPKPFRDHSSAHPAGAFQSFHDGIRFVGIKHEGSLV